ncbi:hypothetical protein U1Q18_048367, partial [Sarracenia purpurea var. burkii]
MKPTGDRQRQTISTTAGDEVTTDDSPQHEDSCKRLTSEKTTSTTGRDVDANKL